MPKHYLAVKEVAKLLGVTPLTVRNWDKNGKLTAYRHPMNNYRQYRVEQVEDLIKELELSKVVKDFVPKSVASKVYSEPEKPRIKKLKIDIY